MKITEDKLVSFGSSVTNDLSCHFYCNDGSATIEVLQGNFEDEKKWAVVQTQVIDTDNPNILINITGICSKFVGLNIKDSSDLDIDLEFNWKGNL